MTKASGGTRTNRPGRKLSTVDRSLDRYLTHNESADWDDASLSQKEAAINRTQWSGFLDDTEQAYSEIRMSDMVNRLNEYIENEKLGNHDDDTTFYVITKDDKAHSVSTYDEIDSLPFVKKTGRNFGYVKTSLISAILSTNAVEWTASAKDSNGISYIKKHTGRTYYNKGKKQ